jgi:hypothetical protein
LCSSCTETTSEDSFVFILNASQLSQDSLYGPWKLILKSQVKKSVKTQIEMTPNTDLYKL